MLLTTLTILSLTLSSCAGSSSPPGTHHDGPPINSDQTSNDEPLVFVEDEVKKTSIVLGEGELAETFKLEIAADDVARSLGLSARDELADDGGMIFIYPRADDRSFWMYNCLMDIEIIFIDPLGRVTATHEMPAEPLRARYESETDYGNRLKRYPSRRMAQFAIEVKPGTLKRLNIQPGDKIRADWEKLAELAKVADRSLPW
ncbi:MAG: DUF192 domain-containing protein [Phycisphaerales bacterium]